MASLFSVGYGSENREKLILEYLDKEYSIALILAAVHFEWMLKRTILVLGKKYTEPLGEELENTYKLTGKDSLEELWKREIGTRVKDGSFRKNIGLKSVYLKDVNSNNLSNHAKDIRSELIHGNRPPGKKRATQAVNDYITASKNLRSFVKKQSENLDDRLSARQKPRNENLRDANV
jgi:hypothetical protein